MVEGYRSSVTLRITGKNINPEAISDRLRLTPSRAWSAGERHPLTPSSTRVQELGSWRLFQPDKIAGRALSEQLEWWCSLLSSRADDFADLEQSGAEIELNCYVQIESASHIELDRRLIAKLANIPLAVTFDVSGSGD